MKKKTKLLIALLLVFVGIGLTYAVYTTSVGGNANVESANWLIKVKTGSDFDNQAGIDVSNGATNINLGSCQKLAPGGSCTLPFRVDATATEVDTVLTVELGTNVTGATLEELTNAGINLRIRDGVNEDYAYLLNMGTYKDLNLVINWEAGDEDDDTKAGYDVNIANKLSSITIPVNMIVKQRLGGTRTVTFNTHDNNIQTPESIQVNDGESILEADIPVLVKNGYIFDGWYTSEVGGTKLTSSTIIINNIEYHARFAEAVTITFDSNGGSSVDPQIIAKGSTLSTIPVSTKANGELIGWFDSNNNELTTSTIINNDITYTASWMDPYANAGTLVYYDPADENTQCNSTSFSVAAVQATTNPSTCYQWRLIKEDASTATIMLDHNLINKSNWGNVKLGPPNKALKNLADETKNWTRVPTLNYSYTDSDGRSIIYSNNKCTVSSANGTEEINGLNVRMITIEEYYSITNKPWIVENISNQYGNGSNSGYYPLNTTLYVINSNGLSSNVDVTLVGNYYGVRPVITVPKTDLSFN